MKPWPFFPKCVDKGKNRETREEKKNTRCKILIRRLAFLHKGAYWGKAPSGGAFFRGVCCGEPCAHQCRVPHRYAEGPSSGAKSGHFWTVYPRKLEICKFYPNVLPTRKLHLRFHLSHALLCCIFLLKHRDFWWDESVGIFYSNACLILKPQKQLVQRYTVFGIPRHCNFCFQPVIPNRKSPLPGNRNSHFTAESTENYICVRKPSTAHLRVLLGNFRA